MTSLRLFLIAVLVAILTGCASSGSTTSDSPAVVPDTTGTDTTAVRPSAE